MRKELIVVTQLSGPWTPAAKAKAFADETKGAVEKYVDMYDEYRNWDPINGPEIAEMSQGVELLSTETKVALDVVTATEAQIPNYVAEGLRGAGDDRTFQRLYEQWGKSEWKHRHGFRTICIASTLKTEKETDAMIADTLSQPWSSRVQFHLEEEQQDDIFMAIFYGRGQEGETADNYEILIERIWRELGAETDQQGRPVLRGIPRMAKHIKIDETLHEKLFKALGRICIQFYPDRSIDAMNQVYHNFTMPIIKMRDPELVYKAALSIGFDSTRKEVLRQSFTDFGLSGFIALRNAMKKVGGLPENAVVQRPTGPMIEILGAPVYEMSTQGDFTLVS